MEDLKIVKERPKFLSILLYILCALFPAVGFMFFIHKDYKDNEKKKIYTDISLVTVGVLGVTCLSFGLVMGANDAINLGGISNRIWLLIVSLYAMLNTSGFLVYNFIYFDKETDDSYRTKKYYITKYIFVALLITFSLIFIYNLDEIVTSFPRGIPWETFSYSGTGKFVVAFYAICILLGALVTLFVSSNNAKREGYERSIFEPIFFVGFPMGIVGARLWYVIAEWSEFKDNLMNIFDIRSGGVAIQGGVLMGAFFGMWIMCEFHREMKLRKAMDLIIPGILLAQAIGRWGNFFNIEVYGSVADPSKWSFLPRVIITHMQALDGNFYVPLFLIESLINIAGYFIITRLIGKLLKKFLKIGDLAFAYFIWYGTVRCIMEPLRNQEFIMGSSSQTIPTSVIMSISFIVIGVLSIVINHVYEYLNTKEKVIEWKNKKYEQFHNLALKFENLPKSVRVILALPIIDGFAYSYYRFIKGHYFSAILWFIFGGLFCWVIDLFTLLFANKVVCSKAYV